MAAKRDLGMMLVGAALVTLGVVLGDLLRPAPAFAQDVMATRGAHMIAVPDGATAILEKNGNFYVWNKNMLYLKAEGSHIRLKK